MNPRINEYCGMVACWIDIPHKHVMTTTPLANVNKAGEPIIRDEFATMLLSAGGIMKAKAIAKAFNDLLSLLENPELCSPGREFSISKTMLEKACFYAKKSMALNAANQQSSERC